MATKTVGTLATTTLTGVLFSHDPNALSNADFATVAEGICVDTAAGGNKPGTIAPGAASRSGFLAIPQGSKSQVELRNGKDWLCNDGFGNAFYIPQRALPKTLTQSVTLVSGSNAVTSAVNIASLGWQVGTHVTSSHTPSGTVIGTIAPSGLSFTLIAFATGLAANATGSATETMTAGTFTHS